MYKKTILKFSILLLTLLSFVEIEAQERFKAGIVGGLNVSQIRGDDTGGFNKIGLIGGLRVNTVLKDKMDITLEIVYSERGSKNDITEPVDVEINLQYVEVPVLFNYKDWYVEDKDYYKVQASAGFAYSRLIDAEINGTTLLHQVEDLTENDFSFVIGAEFFFGKKFSLSGRWHTSINLLHNPDNEPNPNQRLAGLRPHYLSFRFNYFF